MVTQQECIAQMLAKLKGNEELAKISVWAFAGDIKNFITKAEKQGLEYVEKHNDDLVFRLKNG